MEQNGQGICMRGISKDFLGKPALKNVDLSIRPGSVHAIIGENGAGKSTLMNILSGALIPSEGTIEIDGAPARLDKPQDALKYHIGMVHQHFMLIPSMQAWQNTILGIEPTQKLYRLDKAGAKKRIAAACREYGMDVRLDGVTGAMTVGEQQRIEILKVLVREATYIILDEPTAVLTPQEIEQLFRNIRSLQQKGKTILFISHKLEEVMEIADEITVLRLGEKIATVKREDATAEGLVRMMVGRDVKTDGYPKETERGDVRLSVNELCTYRSSFASGLDHITFDVHAGEVLGIAGVDGNGQNELVNAILGMEPVQSGRVTTNGKDTTGASTASVRRAGLSMIPPDRHAQGLVLNSPITMNMVLGYEDCKLYSTAGFLKKRALRKKVQALVEEYDVRIPSIDAFASELSGGNQQKLIFAREAGLRSSDVLLAVNPTRGLDVGAIEFMYEQIENQKTLGKAILLVSTELSEILRLSDRIAVFYKGKCMGILPRAEANAQRIGELMMGVSATETEGDERQ